MPNAKMSCSQWCPIDNVSGSGVGPKSAQSWPKVGLKPTQSRPKVGPRSAQGRPKVGPRSAQSRPKVGPKLAQGRPKVGPKSAQGRPTVGPKSARPGQPNVGHPCKSFRGLRPRLVSVCRYKIDTATFLSRRSEKPCRCVSGPGAAVQNLTRGCSLVNVPTHSAQIIHLTHTKLTMQLAKM